MAALFVQHAARDDLLRASGIAVLVNIVALLSWQFPQYRAFFFEAGDLKEWKSPDHMVWLSAGSQPGAFCCPWEEC